MLKKIFAVCLTAIVILALCACGNSDITEPTDANGKPSESTPAMPTEPVEVTTTFEDYMDEMLEVVHEWMSNKEYSINSMGLTYSVEYADYFFILVSNEEDIEAMKERLLSMGYTEEAVEALHLTVGAVTPT